MFMEADMYDNDIFQNDTKTNKSTHIREKRVKMA